MSASEDGEQQQSEEQLPRRRRHVGARDGGEAPEERGSVQEATSLPCNGDLSHDLPSGCPAPNDKLSVLLSPLTRTLLSLQELQLRLGWLEEQLGRWSARRAADVLNDLCEQSERSDPSAREALLSVAILFASRHDIPALARLREEAVGRRLLALERLVRLGPPPVMLERAPDQLPVPDYGTGRELTLGERRSLARRPDRRAFDKLLADPHPMVIGQLLMNPKLVEADVVRLVARRPARTEVSFEVAKNPRWLARARVRLALVLNPGSPPEVCMPLLCVCRRTDLLEVLKSTDISQTLRGTAVELLEKRPPLREVDEADRILQ